MCYYSVILLYSWTDWQKYSLLVPVWMVNGEVGEGVSRASAEQIKTDFEKTLKSSLMPWETRIKQISQVPEGEVTFCDGVLG